MNKKRYCLQVNMRREGEWQSADGLVNGHIIESDSLDQMVRSMLRLASLNGPGVLRHPPRVYDRVCQDWVYQFNFGVDGALSHNFNQKLSEDHPLHRHKNEVTDEYDFDLDPRLDDAALAQVARERTPDDIPWDSIVSNRVMTPESVRQQMYDNLVNGRHLDKETDLLMSLAEKALDTHSVRDQEIRKNFIVEASLFIAQLKVGDVIGCARSGGNLEKMHEAVAYDFLRAWEEATR
jgi:hypothetical protein